MKSLLCDSGSLFKNKPATRTVLVGENGEAWTFGNLRNFVDCLREQDLLENQNVGVLISDRLIAGALTLGIMQIATCIPINTHLSTSEISETINSLGVSIIITDDHTSVEALPLSGVGVLILTVIEKRPIFKTLIHAKKLLSSSSLKALVLQTSGSTGKPKAVALSHTNINHTVESVIQSLNLGADDVTLNLLPVVHIGGLVDLLIAPLAAGGKVIFSNSRNLAKIHQLITRHGVTWLQGSPAILKNIIQFQDEAPKHSLRFIRSVSAPLPNELYHRIEKYFNTPVIEIYGMSETAGVITSNLLPPSIRKIGSVGLPVNCEVSIRGVGEVWVRGRNVFDGYGLSSDTISEHVNNWFFTGDEGYLDDDGYLFLTGRIKEQINRGGQKLAPREIDRLVENWPEVKEAAAFGITHSSLGEEVALAIVIEDGVTLTDSEIRERLSGSLASYKLPKLIFRMSGLPRNESGKLQRHLISKQIPREKPTISLPKTDTEKKIHKIWSQLLQVDHVGLDDDFFELGGDSISATTMLRSLERTFARSFETLIFYENTTIRMLSRTIDQHSTKQLRKKKPVTPPLHPRVHQRLIRLISSGEGIAPFVGAYCKEVSPGRSTKYGRFFWCANSLLEIEGFRKAMKDNFQVLGFRTLHRIQKRYFRDYPRLIKAYAEQIEKIQPTGDYNLGGFCEGGKIMEGVAMLLEAKGKTVRHLILNDYIPTKIVKAHVSMIFSKQWKNNPLRLWNNPHLAWEKYFGDRFGVFIWNGTHVGYGDDSFHSQIGDFITREAEELQKNEAEEPRKTIKPRCKVELIGRIPTITQGNRDLQARFKIINRGSDTLYPHDGVLLHARWKDLLEPKYGKPMHTNLLKPLEPGDSQELNLTIYTHKKSRWYCLEVGMLEEGQPWPDRTLRFSKRMILY